MEKFTSVRDINCTVNELVNKGLAAKNAPLSSIAGNNKTLGMIFFNPSLRTRMSTQKAAYNLGMNVIAMNIGEEGWKIEFEDGAIMDGGSQEHIKDAVKVMSQYVDLIGVRTFAGLEDKESDYSEKILSSFLEYSEVPVISLESATLHPLQSLADMMTIRETGIVKPKVTVSWAPHPRVLPQAVTNSFLQWAIEAEMDVTLTFPEGYELADEFMQGAQVTNNQSEALEGADIVYTKNWSSYNQYGQILETENSWMIDMEKMALTNNGKFMHCLPVRRNVVVQDQVIDHMSLVYEQAKNREYAAQAVIKEILESN